MAASKQSNESARKSLRSLAFPYWDYLIYLLKLKFLICDRKFLTFAPVV